MDLYPLDLILAVATASATIFLGFLPTKDIAPAFFARETGKALMAWIVVALLSPPAIFHYPLFFAFFCFAAWWHFRRDNALTGKMWLSIASGLGISVGVMFILAVSPRAYPPGLPPLPETLLLASIYLGGAVIGLAYVCVALVLSTKVNSGVTQVIVRRYVGLLCYLTIARAAVFLLEVLQSPSTYKEHSFGVNAEFATSTLHHGPLLILPLLLLVILSFRAQSAVGFSSRVQPTRSLIAILVLGLLAEFYARILVL